MTIKEIVCVNCGKKYPIGKFVYKCPECGGILEIRYDYQAIAKTGFAEKMADFNTIKNIWDFKELLPLKDEQNIVTMQEGNTPILEYRGFRKDSNSPKIYVKDESRNPTGSFKDRPLSVAISKVKEDGSKSVVASTHGNAGVATAAYAAKAGINSYIIIPMDTEKDKVVLMQAFGAKVFQIDGTISDAYNFSLELSDTYQFVNLATTFLSPYTTEGDKTIAFELYKQFRGNPPEWILFPIAAGPILVGCYKGFKELMDLNILKYMPKLVAVQSAACAPIAKAFENNAAEVTAWPDDQMTVATGINEPLRGYPEDGTITLKRIRETHGLAITVSDTEIFDAMDTMAKDEGILAEPTGAVSFAGAVKLYKQNRFQKGERVLAVITGSGYKEMTVLRKLQPAPELVKKDVGAFKKYL